MKAEIKPCGGGRVGGGRAILRARHVFIVNSSSALRFCPYDEKECNEVIWHFRDDACRVKLRIGSYGVCIRLVWSKVRWVK